MKSLSKIILKIFGWKVMGEFPQNTQKAVVIAAPHTSNWDFFLGFFAYQFLGIDARFLVKKEAFFFPMNIIIKKMGGIAVDRSPGNSVVEQVVNAMNSSERFVLTIAPEGTRSRVDEWKSGFYRITKSANVPLFLGMIDYSTKTIGLFDQFNLSDNYESDLKKIMSYYKKEWAKYPQQFAS